MKNKTLLALTVVGLVAAFAPKAQAGSSFHFSIGFPVVAAPAPVVVAAAPVCAAPVVYPRTVYYPTVVCAPSYRYHGHGHHYRPSSHGGHRHGHGHRSGGHR
jgi:hypothetical protein